MSERSSQIECPRCGDVQPPAVECRRCGVIIAKARPVAPAATAPAHSEPAEADSGRGSVPILGIVLVVGLCGAGLASLRGRSSSQPASPVPRQSAPGRSRQVAAAPARVAVQAPAPPPLPAPAALLESRAGEVVVIPVDGGTGQPSSAAGSSGSHPADDEWREGATGFEEADAERKRLGVPMAVYFTADWCVFCKKLDAEILPEPEVEDYLGDLVKVRIDPGAGRAEHALADRFGVKGLPTFLIVPPKGETFRRVHPFFMRDGRAAQMSAAEFVAACRSAEQG